MPEYPNRSPDGQAARSGPRQAPRSGRASRRTRRRLRLLPLLLLLLLVVGLWLLLSRCGREEPEPVQTQAPGSVSATLSFVGDISLDQAMMESFRSGSGYDFTPLLRYIVPLLATSDLTVGNLEGNVISDGSISDHNYPPSLLSALYAAGFDVLQTANSYSIQNGITGLTATKLAIEAAGMEPLGTWASEVDRRNNGVLIREVNGIRIALLAFTKGMNNLRLPTGSDYCVNLLYSDYDTNYSKIARSAIADAVQEARMQNPDVIIAMVHWGSEYDKQITDSQEEIAGLLFDNGVNLIIGSHSHYVGRMELVNRNISTLGGSLIAYSLGDFVSVADTSSARNGCVLSVTFVKDSDGVRISDVTYTPTYSAAPSESLGTERYEVLDTLDAISFYKQGYYERVSDKLYGRLVDAVESLQEQTGQPDMLVQK